MLNTIEYNGGDDLESKRLRTPALCEKLYRWTLMTEQDLIIFYISVNMRVNVLSLCIIYV